jgi:hypothetical protein
MADTKKLAQLLLSMQGQVPSNNINSLLSGNQPLENDLVYRSQYDPLKGDPNAQSYAPTPPTDKISIMPMPGETQEQFAMRLRKANPINTKQYLSY